jgi:hypothetical protein
VLISLTKIGWPCNIDFRPLSHQNVSEIALASIAKLDKGDARPSPSIPLGIAPQLTDQALDRFYTPLNAQTFSLPRRPFLSELSYSSGSEQAKDNEVHGSTVSDDVTPDGPNFLKSASASVNSDQNSFSASTATREGTQSYVGPIDIPLSLGFSILDLLPRLSIVPTQYNAELFYIRKYHKRLGIELHS